MTHSHTDIHTHSHTYTHARIHTHMHVIQKGLATIVNPHFHEQMRLINRSILYAVENTAMTSLCEIDLTVQ